jgi:hypothetical protein
MTSIDSVDCPPIQATFDNPDDWPAMADQLGGSAGIPTALTLETVGGLIGCAVPLLFSADRSGDASLLRGTFVDQVVAQCQRNLGCLRGDRPVSVTVHLVGTPVRSGGPVLRVHLSIATQGADGGPGATSQFWDLLIDPTVTVGAHDCPNCGAPLAVGHVVCEHCHADVRTAVQVPLAVGKLEIY